MRYDFCVRQFVNFERHFAAVMLFKLRKYKTLIILIWIIVVFVLQAFDPINFTNQQFENKSQSVSSISTSVNDNIINFYKEIQSGFDNLNQVVLAQKYLCKIKSKTFDLLSVKRIIPSEFLAESFTSIIPIYLQEHRLNI